MSDLSKKSLICLRKSADLPLRRPLLLRLLLLRGGLLHLLLPLPLPRHRVHRLLRDVQQLHAARFGLASRVGPEKES